MNKLDRVQQKILSLHDLQKAVHVWRLLGQKMVFTNGCFDLLHLGHIDYLSKAADLGNKLIIGLNTDRSVAALKGAGRPISAGESRAAILASLFFVDAVIFFDEDTPLQLIKTLQPDVLVKGADYTLSQIIGANEVTAAGGQVKTISYLPGYSTSAIEQKIKHGSK